MYFYKSKSKHTHCVVTSLRFDHFLCSGWSIPLYSSFCPFSNQTLTALPLGDFGTATDMNIQILSINSLAILVKLLLDHFPEML